MKNLKSKGMNTVVWEKVIIWEEKNDSILGNLRTWPVQDSVDKCTEVSFSVEIVNVQPLWMVIL